MGDGISKALNTFTTNSCRCFFTFSLKVIKVQVCQGNNAPINCGNQAIHIFSATYGRRDKHTCKGPLDITLFWSVDCGATNNALDAVRNDCKGSAACELNANDDRFGDPCWGTPKYLEVSHQ